MRQGQLQGWAPTAPPVSASWSHGTGSASGLPGVLGVASGVSLLQTATPTPSHTDIPSQTPHHTHTPPITHRYSITHTDTLSHTKMPHHRHPATHTDPPSHTHTPSHTDTPSQTPHYMHRHPITHRCPITHTDATTPHRLTLTPPLPARHSLSCASKGPEPPVVPSEGGHPQSSQLPLSVRAPPRAGGQPPARTPGGPLSDPSSPATQGPQASSRPLAAQQEDVHCSGGTFRRRDFAPRTPGAHSRGREGRCVC